MVAILDIVRILYMPLETKRLEIEAKLLWRANIMSYINFQMATLTFLPLKTFQGQNGPKVPNTVVNWLS